MIGVDAIGGGATGGDRTRREGSCASGRGT